VSNAAGSSTSDLFFWQIQEVRLPFHPTEEEKAIYRLARQMGMSSTQPRSRLGTRPRLKCKNEIPCKPRRTE